MKRIHQECGLSIAIVGPCASGKSQLVQALREHGYNAREVLQEHSYVPTMWQRITCPDVLIYLDVSERVAQQRRPTSAPTGWGDTLAQRLGHAKDHADLYIDTDNLTPRQVFKKAMAFIRNVAGLSP